MRQEKRKLTSEQDELRLNGLRILARIITRAHVGFLVEEEAAGRCAFCVRVHREYRSLRKDGGHVR